MMSEKEYMHELLKKDAVCYDLPNEEIIQHLANENEDLEAELKQHRWIPVNEEMPEQVSGHWGSEEVFATDGKQVWVCKYNFSAEYWTVPSGDITHWKPVILPGKD